ncbi:NAD(P)/FAD-dependent oxidoreductase [Gammaproteobacteria bacterium]|nr:NAD(P)/FAD-dependent oxidoreductase [Gammaproteobacteria bacterium]
MTEDDTRKIAVIGAGPMGLGVAFELVNLGYKPVIYEADDRIGGMTATFDFDGLLIERFYHFHCTSDTDFFDIAKRLEIYDKILWRETKMGYWFNEKLQPWGNPLALLKFSGISLIEKIRYGLFAFYCTKIRNWQRLDKKNATTWIKAWVGKSTYEKLWKKLFHLKFYELAEELSAPWIWSRIRRIGNSRYSIFKEKLGHLKGGSSTLLNALHKDLTLRGADIKLSCAVERVVVENGTVAGLKIGGKLELFDTVISTVPLPYIPSLIPDLPTPDLERYRALKNVAVVCVIFRLAKPISENFWVNVNDDRMDIPGFVEYSNLNPETGNIVYIPFYMPASNRKFKESDELFVSKCKSYLSHINSDLTEKDFLAVKVSRYRWAQPVCGPQFLDSLPSPQTAIANLWVADTSHYYPEDRGISESLGFGRNLASQAITSYKQ